MKTIVEVKNLVKKFHIGTGFFTALNGVNITFSEGEFAGLVGPSGSGKTTLLNIIGTLDVPSDGEVVVLARFAVGISGSAQANMPASNPTETPDISLL